MGLAVQAYLHFVGNCEEAFGFYETAIGGKIEALFRFEGTPMESHFGPQWAKKIMHGSIRFGDTLLKQINAPVPYDRLTPRAA